jgi:hypothetical protein
MLLPLVGTRIEELHGLAGHGIDSRQITGFGKLAVNTRQGQVLFFATTAVLTRNDVFDL